MKHIRTRIAVAICAAAASLCTMQALSASAFNTRYPYTPQTQDDREFARNFAHDLYFIQNSYAGQSRWNQTVSCNLMLGAGYTYNNLSGNHEGTTLTGSDAWAMNLAKRFFGNKTAFTEQQSVNKYGDIRDLKRGDQIVLETGYGDGSHHTLFVTGISENRVFCSELIAGTIYWGVEFSRIGDKMYRHYGDSTTTHEYDVRYYIRPVKEGDANGDSIVDFWDYVWVANNLNNYTFPNVRYDILFAAADVNGNGALDTDDCAQIYQHATEGRMTGDYRYVRTY